MYCISDTKFYWSIMGFDLATYLGSNCRPSSGQF